AHTGVGAGRSIGEDPDQPRVGYECDGAPFPRDADGRARPAGGPDSDTPEGFLILGVAELSRAWPTRLGQGATMGIFSVPAGGTVFNAATTDWAKLLELDPTVAQITHNVISRLSSRA
ncbi:MAG: hypothetical protein JWN04_3604, partial [Myxococcaceae bacterium]|nr:hypothetical protein [Myxococcaceae bacterium]